MVGEGMLPVSQPKHNYSKTPHILGETLHTSPLARVKLPAAEVLSRGEMRELDLNRVTKTTRA